MMSLETSGRTSAVQDRVLRYASRGNYSGAEACLLAELRSTHTHPADRICLWNDLGMMYKYLGRFAQSRQLYRRALQTAQNCLQGRVRDFFLADLYHNLGGLDHAQRRFLRGEKFARKGLQLRRRAASESSLAVAVDRAALAALLEGHGKLAAAENLYRLALPVYRRDYGLKHAETAILLSNLAVIYQSTQRFRRAQESYRRALKIKRLAFGAAHPSVAITLNNLGMLELDRGDFRSARSHLQQALRILRRSVGPCHYQSLAIKKNYQLALQTAPSR